MSSSLSASMSSCFWELAKSLTLNCPCRKPYDYSKSDNALWSVLFYLLWCLTVPDSWLVAKILHFESFSFNCPSLFLRSLNSESYFEYSVSICFNKHLPFLSGFSVSRHTASPLPHQPQMNFHWNQPFGVQFYRCRHGKTWGVVIDRAWNILFIMEKNDIMRLYLCCW